MSAKDQEKTVPQKGTEEGQESKTSRRKFLSATGALVAGGALAGCNRLPAMASRPSVKWTALPAKSAAKVMGANDRIRVGVIGTGGMGSGHVSHIMGADMKFGKFTNSEVTALSDVYDRRLERANVMCKGAAKTYKNYQDLLNAGECDAVIIASPEHWHHQMSVDAHAAGMHVYLQKPMTRTFEEAVDLHKRFKDSKNVFQLGSQYCQKPVWWHARELYKKGYLGHLVMGQTGYHRNSLEGEWQYSIDDDVNPGPGGNLDWRAWLGPLPYEEWNPEYYFRWRKYKEISGGIITDLLPHRLHSLVYVFGADYPRAVTCVGGIYAPIEGDVRTVADTVAVTIDYHPTADHPAGYSLIMTGSTVNERGQEDIIRGHEATMIVGDKSVKVTPERPFTDEMDAIDDTVEPAILGDHQWHLREFFNAVRGDGQTTWNVEDTFRVMIVIAMIEQALNEQRTVHFDAEKMRIV